MSITNKMAAAGSKKEVRKASAIVKKIEALAETYAQYTDAELRAKTDEFKVRLQGKETLDDILPEAFATVREASRRVLGLYHYPVQLIAGVILHQGRIAEMRTGEGKTLMATLPAYLNALEGNGVHVVTANDYLARRDSEQMGKVYRFLGLSVGLIIHDIEREDRKAAYAADITYCTNNEVGFDYLRDNMAQVKDDQVMRGMNFAIVDEVDSLLIDEARTPLIISGQSDEDDSIYHKVEEFVSSLEMVVIPEWNSKDELMEDIPYDYLISEKEKSATLTERGVEKAEAFFHIDNISDPQHLTLAHRINQAIRAHGLMKRDVNYVVSPEGEVIIVDEHTGRLMYGRRFSDGMHQAIEAKEHVQVHGENKTWASITFQNFFRMYKKLSGMTGTAMTEESEFAEIYKLDIVEIPTNRPVIRVDLPDVVYKTEEAKYNAVIEMVKERHALGQPVLIGTSSIERNEEMSRMLNEAGVPHNVLNAKNHEAEAYIIAQAGRFGAVTVATNMAGRGTDIMLGGNAEYMAVQDLLSDGYSEAMIAEATGFSENINDDIRELRVLYQEKVKEHRNEIAPEVSKVRDVGGLCVIGTQRHDSRRVDNQLRGRSGRQGDPGLSQFFLSLEDELLRLFGGEQIITILNHMDVSDDMPITYKRLSAAIENAQKTVESRHYQMRKNVLEYDDVMDVQRKVMYENRQRLLDGEAVSPVIDRMVEGSITRLLDRYFSSKEQKLSSDDAITMMDEAIHIFFPQNVQLQLARKDMEAMTYEQYHDIFLNASNFVRDKVRKMVGEEEFDNIQRNILLRTVDDCWTDELVALDILQKDVGLCALGGKNPIDEFKKQAYEMFDRMNDAIQDGAAFYVANLRIVPNAAAANVAE